MRGFLTVLSLAAAAALITWVFEASAAYLMPVWGNFVMFFVVTTLYFGVGGLVTDIEKSQEIEKLIEANGAFNSQNKKLRAANKVFAENCNEQQLRGVYDTLQNAG